jgi:RNA polymerase sigma-70 factor (ECF subfamily)
MIASPSLTDEDVVRRVVGGERELFEVLMRRHDQRVYRAIRGILRDEDDVEDAMQQAWLQAYLHLGEFAGAARFSTWMTRIAANEALGRLRRRARLEPAGGEEADGVMDANVEDPEVRAAAREATTLLESAVDRLAPGYRAVFMLRDVENLSTAETATALGLGEEAVKVRLHRARAMLRKTLTDAVDEAAADAFPFLAPRCNRIVNAVMSRILGGRPGAA